MSILIKGMEMPGEDEEIIIRIDSSGTVMTEYALPIPWMKAVPVPPHGRLIDESMIPWCVDWYAGRKRYYTTPKNIEHLPTIIPAEEREG